MKQWTPITLFDALSETVIGQDDYLMSLCTTVWLHDARIQLSKHSLHKDTIPQKQNLLIVGPTGSGKTLAIQSVAKLLGYDVLIANAPDFTGNGWQGRDVEEIIADLYKQCGDNQERTMQGIIFLDEIDKVILGQAERAEYRTFGIENVLLKMVEGYPVYLKKAGVAIDTSNILFIVAGAFEGIEKIIQKRVHGQKKIGFEGNVWSGRTDKDLLLQVKKTDLIKYGIGPQFLGRFSRLTSLRELNADDIKYILLNSKASTVKAMDELLFDSLGIHVDIDEAGAKAIAEQAIKEKTGARGAAFMVQEVMNESLFFLPDEKNIKGLFIFSKDGKPEIEYVSGQPEEEKAAVSQPILIKEKDREHIMQYVDELLDSGRDILNSCNLREIRALHYLLSAIVIYILNNCSESDFFTSSIKILLKTVRGESENLDEETVCEKLMTEDGNDKESKKLFYQYKALRVNKKVIDYAMEACEKFERKPSYEF